MSGETEGVTVTDRAGCDGTGHGRALLGPADVSDGELARLAAAALDVPGEQVELLESSAEVAAYDLEALTTAGRYRVRGRVRTAGGDRAFSFFVKVVQSWARSPLFAVVPAELREQALAQLPWRSEPDVYRSDLAGLLPAGLSMPVAYSVVDLDQESAALWLQHIDVVPTAWDRERFAQAAGLLGRLAASPQVRPVAQAGRRRNARAYADSRVAHQVLPALRSAALWEHPLIAGAFDEALRADLLAAADALPDLLDELETLPVGTVHGDACSRNLLVQRDSPDLALIDFGFWGVGPLGYDLGQLLLGEVQLGERPADCLPDLESDCLSAYVGGLRQEGCDVPAGIVQRAHALSMLLFSGLSAPPLEYLHRPPTDDLHRIAGERARSARFILDLVRATAAAG